MTNQAFNVTTDFIIDALQARYNNVKDLWGGDAAHELWEQALSMVEECGIGDNVTSPSIFVDNYLINGEFVSKEDDLPYWIDCEYGDLSEDDKSSYSQSIQYCKSSSLLTNSPLIK